MYQSIKSLSAVAAAVASVVIGGWRAAGQSRLWSVIKDAMLMTVIVFGVYIAWAMYSSHPAGTILMLQLMGLAYLALCGLVGFLIVTTILVDKFCAWWRGEDR